MQYVFYVTAAEPLLVTKGQDATLLRDHHTRLRQPQR
jgi:hypothetical protein